MSDSFSLNRNQASIEVLMDTTGTGEKHMFSVQYQLNWTEKSSVAPRSLGWGELTQFPPKFSLLLSSLSMYVPGCWALHEEQSTVTSTTHLATLKSAMERAQQLTKMRWVWTLVVQVDHKLHIERSQKAKLRGELPKFIVVWIRVDSTT